MKVHHPSPFTRPPVSQPGACTRTILVALLLGQSLPAPSLPSPLAPPRGAAGELEFHRRHPEVFYSTRQLPNGLEVETYATRGRATRYFFLNDRNASRLTFRVSACGAVVSWTLYYMHDPQPDYDIRPDDSGAQPVHTPLSTRQPQPIELKTCRRCRGFTEYTSPHPAPAPGSAPAPAPGLYSLVLRANSRNTTVKLFASTSLRDPLPRLPSDPRLTVLLSPAPRSRAVVLAWRPTRARRGSNATYWLAVNTRGPLESLCAARAALTGDPRPTPPPNAGFGFPRERQSLELSRGAGVGMGVHGMAADPDLRLIQVGEVLEYKYTGPLVAGTKYYFDLFAVDNDTRTSITYTGTNVTLPQRKQRKVIEMKDSELRTLQLKLKNASSRSLQLVVVDPAIHTLLVDIRVCGGSPVRVDVCRGEETVADILLGGSDALSTGRLVHIVPNPGEYKLSVRRLERNGYVAMATVQLYATSSRAELNATRWMSVEALERSCQLGLVADVGERRSF